MKLWQLILVIVTVAGLSTAIAPFVFPPKLEFYVIDPS